MNSKPYFSQAAAELVEDSNDVTKDRECFAELCALAGRKFGSLPPPWVAQQIMRVCVDTDWPVRRAALEALGRRYAAIKSDKLEVSRVGRSRRLLGLYRAKVAGRAKPYEILLRGVDPVQGSCSCPDYARSSLGLCKHLLAVLEQLFRGPAKLKKARQEQADFSRTARSLLRWDPVRPALGLGDWLERVLWERVDWPVKVVPAMSRYFSGTGNGISRLTGGAPIELSERLKVVKTLLAFKPDLKSVGVPLELVTDPALQLLLRQELQQLQAKQRTYVTDLELKRGRASLKQRLYPYQVAGVAAFIRAERLVLADDMGLGKTVQAVAACHFLWRSRWIKRGLLIVPAALKSQWEREWCLFSDAPVTIVEGKREEREAIYRRQQRGFLIANYEQVLKDLVCMHQWQPDLIVLDEAQRIKNWSTKTAAFIKQLQPRWRLVLTGTPMENRLTELASVVEWVDSHALEPKWRLLPWHNQFIDGGGEVGGARNLDTIRTRLKHCLVRRLREEVLQQLPPRTDSKVTVTMTATQRSEHNQLSESILKLIGASRKRPLTQAEFLKLMALFARQRVISNGMAQANFAELWPDLSKIQNPTEQLLGSLDSPKLVELRELITQVVVTQRLKTVIFSQWTRMLELAHWSLQGILRKEGMRAVFFTGREKQRRRTQNIVDFHDDERVRILFASDAGGVGLNLQRAASCCINLELPWNPAVLEQRIGRIYRNGQSQPVSIYNLVSEWGIEARILALVGSKRALFKGLFDGASNEVSYDQSGNMLSQLERMVDPVSVPELTIVSPGEDGDEAGFEGGDDTVDWESEPMAGDSGREAEAIPGEAEVPSREQAAPILAGISIERRGADELLIKAPPDQMATLATLFENLAGQLRKAM